jgi:hypothetical protein
VTQGYTWDDRYTMLEGRTRELVANWAHLAAAG